MSAEEAERAMGLITISKDEGVAHVQLARPTRLNAIDNALFAALIEAGECLRQDQGLRAVVLSGQGRAFCAGLDMDLFRGMVDGSGRNVGGAPIMPRRYGHANGPQQAILTWRALPVPVIAAIHGVAFGAGLQLALAADIRVATPDARLSALEMKWGLVPDLGGFAIMRRLTGDDRLRELVYTARVLSGTEAQRYGLVTQVADDALGSALILAREIADRNPAAIRAAKRLANLALDASEQTLLQAESLEQAHLIGTAFQIEAVRAALAGDKPDFG